MKKKLLRLWNKPTENEQAVVMSFLMAGYVVASVNANIQAIAYVWRVLLR